MGERTEVIIQLEIAVNNACSFVSCILGIWVARGLRIEEADSSEDVTP